MMLSKIITTRKYKAWPSFHLIYEWEDIISNTFNIPLFYESKLYGMFNSIIRRVPYNGSIPLINKKYSNMLRFEISAKNSSDTYNRENILPVIVDFHISESDLTGFINAYKNNPFVLISSAEVMKFLDEREVPLKYYHFPLSLPDFYQFKKDMLSDKKYDLLLAGRQNPILKEYLDQYIKENPNFIYVYEKLEDGKFTYCTNKGEILGEFKDRKSYISLLRQSRVSLYSTPGIDGGESRTKGFNQVTPKFLEFLAAGCHVLARYKDNPDTDFFHISEFSPHINSYEMFRREMDYALNHPIDADKYESYLKKHYTSCRVNLLKNILKNYN